MSSELRIRARARALRAARAVTLGSALVACSTSHTPDGGDASTDAALVRDSGSDAPLVCPPIFPPTTQECCEAQPGGFWDGEQCIVAVPGPFVPPRMA
ncbi:MAG: hypothetical protein MUE69_07365 [Myxococcota bacterium]|jgi:hypothetical protein|nr:hypothetical protein [Myxococcota bacterium]